MRRLRLGLVAVVLALTSALSLFHVAPAGAGVGYWSYGCNPRVQWFEFPNETSFRTNYWNASSGNTHYIQYKLRSMWKWVGSECRGNQLASNERYQYNSRTGHYGYMQYTSLLDLWWDADCNKSYIFNWQTNTTQYGFCWA